MPGLDGALVEDVATGDGLLIAVGYTEPDSTPAVWASTDGWNWSQLHDVPVSGWGWHVAIREGTIVAMAEDGTVLLGTHQP